MPGRATVSIIDCGHGNLASVDNALRAIGAEPIICADPEQVRRAEMLVFPGQGSAPSAIRSLRETGMGDALLETIRRGVPSLGICLGMQLALDHSSEGPVNCLGLIPGRSVRFDAETTPGKIPQIGWNHVRHDGDGLFEGIPSGTHFYFVHSYYCLPERGSTGWTDFGVEYSSALHQDNFWATQFHPEKSGRLGLMLLQNFLKLAKC